MIWIVREWMHFANGSDKKGRHFSCTMAFKDDLGHLELPRIWNYKSNTRKLKYIKFFDKQNNFRSSKIQVWVDRVRILVCLFVCLGIIVRLENFSHMETSALPVKGCKFWPMLMAIKQWGFFSVPHLMGHGAYIYNGHLWGPMTLSPIA